MAALLLCLQAPKVVASATGHGYILHLSPWMLGGWTGPSGSSRAQCQWVGRTMPTHHQLAVLRLQLAECFRVAGAEILGHFTLRNESYWGHLPELPCQSNTPQIQSKSLP